MTSWRESASQQAQDDLDELLNVVVPFGEQTLERYGELFPYGAAIALDGRTALLAADAGPGGDATSHEAYDSLREGARRDRDGFRAVAIAADVRVHGGGDAIRVDTEHRDGVALTLLIEYSLERLGGGVTIGDVHVMTGEPFVWESGGG